MSSVPSKLCACARAHRVQRLRTRINLLRTGILLYRRFVVDHKITITRQTINFSDTKTAPFLGKDPIFLPSPNFGHKNRFNCGWILRNVHTRQNFCAQRPHKIRGNIAYEFTKTMMMLQFIILSFLPPNTHCCLLLQYSFENIWDRLKEYSPSLM